MATNKLIRLLLAVSALILLIIIVFTYSASEKRFLFDTNLESTVRFETIKSLLQILLVVIIGTGITAIFKAIDTNREQSKLKIETWKDYIKKIEKSYYNVKRIRRELIAEGFTTKHENSIGVLSDEQLDYYYKKMELLNDVQLELEILKIETTYFPEFLSLDGVSKDMNDPEDYIRQILKEYEKIKSKSYERKKIDFNTMKRLKEFTTSTKVEVFTFSSDDKKTDYRFKTHFSEPFKNLLEQFKLAFKKT